MTKLIDLLEKKGIDRNGDNKVNSKDWEISRDIAIKQSKEMQKENHDHPDHEIYMAKTSLKSIAKSVMDLMQKLEGGERDIPAWIQDHISNAENFIDQAAQGFHELPEEDPTTEYSEMNESERLKQLAGILKESH